MKEISMSTKEQILKYLSSRTHILDPEKVDIFTTNAIAENLHISRTVTSQYLNEMVEDRQILKVKSRPVYFFHLGELENKYAIRLRDSDFLDMADLFAYIRQNQTRESGFRSMIGSNGSLKRTIQQGCELFEYPPHGLPFVIYGNEGVGKRMLADLICRSSQMKGNTVGFNTKIHRIEVQETDESIVQKLNTLISDHGIEKKIVILSHFERITQEAEEYLASLFEAGKTDDIHFIFLSNKTPRRFLHSGLMKHIPLALHLNDFEGRPKEEREGIIAELFRKEAENLNATIQISSNVMRTLSHGSYSDNIQGLLNSIRLICASALTHMENHHITVHSYDMPQNQLEKIRLTNEDVAMIDCTNYQPSGKSMIYQDFFQAVLESFNEPNASEISSKFTPIYAAMEEHMLSSNRQDHLLQGMEVTVANIVNQTVQNRFINVPGNFVYMLAKLCWIYHEYENSFHYWEETQKEKLDRAYSVAMKEYVSESMIADEINDLMTANLENNLPVILQLIISLVLYRYNKDLRNRDTYGVIICHGYGTASSIANAVNSLAGSYLFDSIDMPINTSVEVIKETLIERLSRVNRYANAVILVDMGSLEEIAPEIANISRRNIAIINNISTKLALSIGYQIKNAQSLSDIFKSTEDEFTYEHTVIYGKEKDIILFISESGLQTSQRMADLFRDSLPSAIPVELQIASYDKVTAGHIEDVQSSGNLLFITGTDDPHVSDVPFIPLESIITSSSLDIVASKLSSYLDESGLKQLSMNIRRNFTLINVVNYLTILNPKPLLDFTTVSIDTLQQRMHMDLEGKRLVGMYIHVCVLIERLVTKSGVIREDEETRKFAKEHPLFLREVRASFKAITDHYNIEIPDAEMMYLYSFTSENKEGIRS